MRTVTLIFVSFFAATSYAAVIKSGDGLIVNSDGSFSIANGSPWKVQSTIPDASDGSKVTTFVMPDTDQHTHSFLFRAKNGFVESTATFDDQPTTRIIDGAKTTMRNVESYSAGGYSSCFGIVGNQAAQCRMISAEGCREVRKTMDDFVKSFDNKEAAKKCISVMNAFGKKANEMNHGLPPEHVALIKKVILVDKIDEGMMRLPDLNSWQDLSNLDQTCRIVDRFRERTAHAPSAHVKAKNAQ